MPYVVVILLTRHCQVRIFKSLQVGGRGGRECTLGGGRGVCGGPPGATFVVFLFCLFPMFLFSQVIFFLFLFFFVSLVPCFDIVLVCVIVLFSCLLVSATLLVVVFLLFLPCLCAAFVVPYFVRSVKGCGF